MDKREALTAQELFDNALKGIRGQDYRVSMCGPVCMYRGTGGLKCAIGHSIPDDLYDPEFDFDCGFSCEKLDRVILGRTGTPLFVPEALNLAQYLQHAHDSLKKVVSPTERRDRFEYQMRSIADKHHLEYTPTQGT